MKAVLMSIQPYYVFLIIARLAGWRVSHDKTVEVRKDFPKDPAWNKTIYIYCSKNRKSLNRFPKCCRPYIEKWMGKVVGEFVCNNITDFWCDSGCFYRPTGQIKFDTWLDNTEFRKYGKGKPLYGWHISDLKIYDKPKELGEFSKPRGTIIRAFESQFIKSPPQSWCYVEALK